MINTRFPERRIGIAVSATRLAMIGVALLGISVAVADTPAEKTAADTLGLMYWTNLNEGIYRAVRDGSDVKLVLEMKGVDGLAVDAEGEKLYFTVSAAPTLNADRLLRANLDGTEITELASGLNYTGDVVFDPQSQKLYVSSLVGRKILQCNPDGTEMKDFLTGLINPDEMALDLEKRLLYWAYSGPGGPIQRAKLDDGSELADVVTIDQRRMGIALDPAEKHIYWVDADTGNIWRSGLDGKGETVILSGRTDADSLALDLDNRKMYWTEPNKICQANLDGTGIEVLVTGKTQQYGTLVILPPKE